MGVEQSHEAVLAFLSSWLRALFDGTKLQVRARNELCEVEQSFLLDAATVTIELVLKVVHTRERARTHTREQASMHACTCMHARTCTRQMEMPPSCFSTAMPSADGVPVSVTAARA